MDAPSAAVGAAVSQMCISRAPLVEWCTGFKTEQKKKRRFWGSCTGEWRMVRGSHAEFLAVKRAVWRFAATTISGRGGEQLDLYTALVYRGDAGFLLGEGYKLRMGHEVMDGASGFWLL